MCQTQQMNHFRKQEEAVNQFFSKQAARFDIEESENRIIQSMRSRIRQHMLTHLKEGDNIPRTTHLG